MYMAIDESGEEEKTIGIDCFVAAHMEIRSDCAHHAIFKKHICFFFAHIRHEHSVCNEERRHALSSIHFNVLRLRASRP